VSTTSPSGSASHPEDTSENVAVLAAQSASGKGATDLLVLAVGPILAICEHFVIGTASNTRLVMAAAQEVEDKLAEVFGRRPIAVEGREDRRWVLLDYGDVVVTCFSMRIETSIDLSDSMATRFASPGNSRQQR
jgi:ribosome-associated protein